VPSEDRDQQQQTNFRRVLGLINAWVADPAWVLTEDLINTINALTLDGIGSEAVGAGTY